MTLKDFLPLIGTIITVVAGYVIISVQVNKNRRAKWIDDFRKEIANFFALATSLNKEFSIDKSYELLRCISFLNLYLFDSKEPPRRELVSALREFQAMTLEKKSSVETLEEIEKFGKKLGQIMNYASQVILNEQAKI